MLRDSWLADWGKASTLRASLVPLSVLVMLASQDTKSLCLDPKEYTASFTEKAS